MIIYYIILHYIIVCVYYVYICMYVCTYVYITAMYIERERDTHDIIILYITYNYLYDIKL